MRTTLLKHSNAFCFISVMIFSLLFIKSLFAVTVDGQIEIYQEVLRNKLQEEVGKFLGPETKFSVFVKVNSSPFQQPEATVYDLGYLPRPLVKEQRNYANPIEVNSVDANIMVYENLDTKVLDQVKTIVSSSLQGLNPVIAVAKASLPERKIASVEEPKEELAPVLPPKTMTDRWFEAMPALSPVAKALILALAGLLGLLIIWGISMGLVHTVGETTKNVLAAYSDNKSKEMDAMLKAEENKANSDAAKLQTEVKNVNDLKAEIGKYVQTIRQVLAKEAHLFAKDLGKEDFIGIRSLLPYLAESEVHILKFALGRDASKQIRQLIELKSEPMTLAELARWLGRFVEKLTVLSIQSNNNFEKLLPQEIVNELYLMEPERLITAGLKLNSTLAWRTIIEFMPKQHIGQLITNLGEDEWKSILDTQSFNTEQAIESAKMVLKEAKDTNSILEDALLSTDSLIESVVKTLNEKPVGDDEVFLEKIGNISEKFAAEVKKRFWTREMIAYVPASYLSDILRTNTPEDTVQLLVAIPPREQEYIMSLIPEGKGKIIISDRIKYLMANPDENYMVQAAKSARTFIRKLQEENLKAAFKLLDKPWGYEESAPAVIEKAS
jgi:hypothetical protein